MASFSPTMRLSSVDLPTLGRPRIATVPATVRSAAAAASLCRLLIAGCGSGGLLYHAGVVYPGACAFLLTLAAVVCCSARHAASPAAPPVTLTPGAPTAASTSATATRVVAHVALKTPALRRGQPRLREVVVDGHRIAELRVPVRGTPAEEVWIGERRPAKRGARSLWSGMTGPRDADGETSIGVEVDARPRARVPDRRRASPAATASPARLFPRAYDFDSGRFRPIMSPLARARASRS